MKGVTFPDPFAVAPTGACKLTCAATVGPCYAKSEPRKDISEGVDGLPLRVSLLVVDEQCRPLSGVELDVWHAAPAGVYSGDDADPMCTGNDAKARAARFFRGRQTTDAKGRVDFDTCYPGWYHGRTVHIHFTARLNGNEAVTSQLFFEDALNAEISAKQIGYRERGRADTTNQNDGVIAADEVKDYLFETSRTAGGVMVARKAIMLRPAGAGCEVRGGPRPPGPPPRPHDPG